MAREGYLAGVLAAGQRPVRHRGAVLRLLGLVDDAGVEVSFPSLLLPAGLPGLLPRRFDEFADVDDGIETEATLPWPGAAAAVGGTTHGVDPPVGGGAAGWPDRAGERAAEPVREVSGPVVSDPGVFVTGASVSELGVSRSGLEASVSGVSVVSVPGDPVSRAPVAAGAATTAPVSPVSPMSPSSSASAVPSLSGPPSAEPGVLPPSGTPTGSSPIPTAARPALTPRPEPPVPAAALPPPVAVPEASRTAAGHPVADPPDVPVHVIIPRGAGPDRRATTAAPHPHSRNLEPADPGPPLPVPAARPAPARPAGPRRGMAETATSRDANSDASRDAGADAVTAAGAYVSTAAPSSIAAVPPPPATSTPVGPARPSRASRLGPVRDVGAPSAEPEPAALAPAFRPTARVRRPEGPPPRRRDRRSDAGPAIVAPPAPVVPLHAPPAPPAPAPARPAVIGRAAFWDRRHLTRLLTRTLR